MAALQLPPHELVFVDDRKVNVDAARAVGMDAILFEGAAALERELAARGLTF
jgi:FMN phosphatase YigB (HAD superfamily)